MHDRWNPLCESPIEFQLAYALAKHVRHDVAFEFQKPIETVAGDYRVDFYLTGRGKSVALEADGREFHEYRRDCRRDAAILSTGCVHSLVRIPGRAVHNVLQCVMFSLAQWYSQSLFDDRQVAILNTLSNQTEYRTELSDNQAFIISQSNCFSLERRELKDRLMQDYLRKIFNGTDSDD